MTPLLEALSDIEERLKNATPGPWLIERVDHEHEITFEIGTNQGFFAKIYEHNFIDQGRNAKPTCELITNAPTDLRRCLEIIAVLSSAVDQYTDKRARKREMCEWDSGYNCGISEVSTLLREAQAKALKIAKGDVT